MFLLSLCANRERRSMQLFMFFLILVAIAYLIYAFYTFVKFFRNRRSRTDYTPLMEEYLKRVGQLGSQKPREEGGDGEERRAD